jgi:hypothetical protein
LLKAYGLASGVEELEAVAADYCLLTNVRLNLAVVVEELFVQTGSSNRSDLTSSPSVDLDLLKLSEDCLLGFSLVLECLGESLDL